MSIDEDGNPFNFDKVTKLAHKSFVDYQYKRETIILTRKETSVVVVGDEMKEKPLIDLVNGLYVWDSSENAKKLNTYSNWKSIFGLLRVFVHELGHS